MTGYGFFRSIYTVLCVALVPLAGLAAFVGVIWHEVAREAAFRRQFGAGWESEYEATFGALSKAHNKIALACIGIGAVCSIVFWLYRIVRNDQAGGRRGQRRRRHRRNEGSPVERVVRYKRNAIVGLYFGVAGIAVGVALVLFYFGIFADPENEVILGIFVFLSGYLAVISGCWWWLKAKAWSEAVVAIGLLPLVILFIPFVRLIFVAAPLLLAVGMVMMPLVLIVVVLVLPDKSGVNQGKL